MTLSLYGLVYVLSQSGVFVHTRTSFRNEFNQAKASLLIPNESFRGNLSLL